MQQQVCGRWLIHGTEFCKDNQLQSLQPGCTAVDYLKLRMGILEEIYASMHMFSKV